MYLRVVRIKDVKLPSRGHYPDAGIDFYIPKDYNETVMPHSNKLIPSGVKVEIPIGYMGLFLNKSGVASKKELLIGAQLIDCYYSGEVHIDIHNVGSNPIILEPDMKIAQMVLVPISHCQIMEIENENDLYDDFIDSSYRGSKGFGSTDHT